MIELWAEGHVIDRMTEDEARIRFPHISRSTLAANGFMIGGSKKHPIWKESEDNALRHERLNLQRISTALNRSVDAIHCRASELKLKWPKAPPKKRSKAKFTPPKGTHGSSFRNDESEAFGSWASHERANCSTRS